MQNYEILDALGSGTYGVVSKARNKHTGEIVALKRIKLDQEEEGIPSTTIREITLLRKLKHRNIIGLFDVIYVDKTLVLVFELLAEDLRQSLDRHVKAKGKRIGLDSAICESYMYQLLRGLAFCHHRRVIHRDLKPQNLLVSHDGALKIADFGLARGFGVPVRSFTHQVITLWYRAPDILMGNRKYSTPCDLWSVGCIFAEMVTSRPLFPGQNEESELVVIFRKMGPPSKQNFPSADGLPDWNDEYVNIKRSGSSVETDMKHFMDAYGLDLIKRLLVYDPKRRITARQSLNHAYFQRMHRLEQERKKIQEVNV